MSMDDLARKIVSEWLATGQNSSQQLIDEVTKVLKEGDGRKWSMVAHAAPVEAFIGWATDEGYVKYKVEGNKKHPLVIDVRFRPGLEQLETDQARSDYVRFPAGDELEVVIKGARLVVTEDSIEYIEGVKG